MSRARMIDRSHPGTGNQEFLELVSRVMNSETLDAVLAAGAELVATAAGAPMAAAFATQGAATESEAWHPVEARFGPEAALLLRRAAFAVASEHSDPPSVAGAMVVAGYPLRVAGRIVGAVVAAWPATGETVGAPPTRDVKAAVDCLACRIALHSEGVRFEAQRNHYERWFQTLDGQLRVLDRERQKFASIVNQTDAYVYVVDTQRAIQWTNKALPLRFPPPGNGSGWIGRRSCDLCAVLGRESSGACSACPIQRALDTDEGTHQEVRQMQGEGARTLYLSAVPIKGPDGRAQEVIVTIQDLTDLKVMRQSESRYRALFEQSSTAILMVDPDTWGIVIANATAGLLFGCAAPDLTRLHLSDIHGAAEWPALEEQYRDLLENEPQDGVECPLRRRDGRERVARVHARHFELDGRRLLMVECRDITERRRAEAALHAAEERLQTVVANSPLVLFSIDRSLRFTLSEGRGLQALGLEPGQVVGCRLEDVYGDHPEIMQSIHRALAGDEFVETVNVGDLAFETWYAPLRGEAGAIEGMVGVATDVTESRRLEEQLRQSQKMEAVGRLAGGVAHDFNNLLTVLMGHCEFLVGGLEPGSRWHREAEAIQKAGTRGALLARQLLAFSRREVVEPRVLDLNAVLAGIAPMLQRLLGEDIDLATTAGEAPMLAKADNGQIEQVLMNLAVNARDAMPSGGRLTIEVSGIEIDETGDGRPVALAPGPYVMLAVTDTGLGMDAETLSHLFEPFFTTKPTGRGTGLGMSIVYGIVRQYDGRIHVESEPGRGTTIRVYLPRIVESAAPAGRPGSAEALAGTETILVVEDEKEVRAIACEILEMHGYRVHQAADGEEALAFCDSFTGRLDLVLSDVVMPGMGGGELAVRLQRLRPGLPLLFMSGYTDDVVVRHCVRARDRAFIQKPFTVQGLVRKVRETLDESLVPGDEAPRGAAA